MKISSGQLPSPGSTRAEPFVRLLLADDFRVEQGGKILAVGLYPDRVIVFQLPAKSPSPTAKKPYGTSGIAVLVTIGGREGDFEVSFTMGNNKPLMNQVHIVAGGAANLIFLIRPFAVNAFGMKEIVVRVDREEHRFEFEVRRKDVDAPKTSSAPLKPRRKIGTKPKLEPADKVQSARKGAP